ncbi:MAG: hypothetical protein ACT4RN_10350 [Pseudonocardia sp.]
MNDEQPPRAAPVGNPTQAMFDEHYAGVLAGAAIRGGGGGGGSGGFTVDPDGYRIAIDKLTLAVREMEDGLHRWGNHRTDQIGTDPVSVQLRINMEDMHRRAMEYARAWTQQIRETRDGLQAQLDAYETAERRNVARLT